VSRRPARFTQADIARAIRAVRQAGAGMAVEVLPNGIIRISPQESGISPDSPPVEPDKPMVL
jgi:hypothetical protein